MKSIADAFRLNMKRISGLLIAALGLLAAERLPAEVLEAQGPAPATVDSATMERVYREVQTPFKYGVVLRGSGSNYVDCPSVFRSGSKWFMAYIEFDGSGYETRLARSEDLLHWQPLGRILSRGSGGWDDQQLAGFVALQNPRWGGSYRLGTHQGRYWMSYVGGSLKGYETDPLSIGMAWSKQPALPQDWHRVGQPVLSPSQPDARYWERLTLYKSNIIPDKNRRLGWPFVMFYNAKTKSGYERIGMAVSTNLVDWVRYGQDPVIDNGQGISGDPQLARWQDLWIMFYFGAFWRPNAFDTFAVSRDLVHWTKWTGPDLVKPSEPWDRTYAHKPWVLKHQGVVYHFYCAVGDQGRVIALATSRDLTPGNAAGRGTSSR